MTTQEKTQKYSDILQFWQKRINLISKTSTVQDIQKHIQDCEEITGLLPQNTAVVDIGSGAGLPGIVLGIHRSDLKIVLSEVNKKKCTFLRTVIHELDLDNVTVTDNCITQLKMPLPFFISRAVCELEKLLAMMQEHYFLNQMSLNEAVGLFQKGDHLEAEIKKAQEKFNFTYTLKKGVTYENRQIIEIKNISTK